jgi:O-6-methylguanine DNA methyltransferase
MTATATPTTRIRDRVDALDWEALRVQLDTIGHAVAPPLLDAAECEELSALFEDGRFRTTIEMARHRFGDGRYRYFDHPLPERIAELRTSFYRHLALIANDWSQLLRGDNPTFPLEHEELLERCCAAGQSRPTPLILRYGEGDWNALHQDLYGEVYFPFQVLTILSEPGVDFEGGPHRHAPRRRHDHPRTTHRPGRHLPRLEVISRSGRAGRLTTMTSNDNKITVEQALARGRRADPAAWARMQRDLLARAETEGLIDVAFERHDSPLGTIVVGATTQGIVRVWLPAESEEALHDELARRVSPRILHAPRATLSHARQQLNEYFDGSRHAFDIPLDWRLTHGFRHQVLRATAEIPYGRTASYRDVATRAGNPAAVRAAGTALTTNPLPILVPCHRVLRTGGALGSYRGGSAAKAQLLNLEGVTV